MSFLYILFTVIIMIVCALLILIVLIQKPKGSGLAAGFSGLNSSLGVGRTTDAVEKWTWSLSIALLVFAILINFFIDRGSYDAAPTGSQLENVIDGYNPPSAAPQITPNGGATPPPAGQGQVPNPE